MWQYRQSDGALSRGGEVIAHGYSGHGAGVNNHAMEGVAKVGPIPCGRYTIGKPFDHPTVGKFAMRLTPNAGTNTHGRSGFLMHGDNSAGNHTASEGCIVAMHPTRMKVAQSDSDQIEVVP